MPDIVEDPLLRNKRKKMIYINSYTGQQIPTAGLVGYYALDGDANDGSGTGNDGTLVGPTFQSGQGKNGCYSFLTNDYINIDPLVNDLNSATGTWFFWVKPTDITPSSQEILLGFGDTNANETIFLSMVGTSGVLRLACVISATVQFDLRTNANPFTVGEWASIAVVHNGTTPVIYVNAVEVAQTFNVSTDKTAWFSDSIGIDNGRIGCLNYLSAGNFIFYNGLQDELRFYNTNLSGAEILQLHDFDKSVFGL